MTTQKMKSSRRPHLYDLIWDAWCLLSVVGIWPRFIEPNLLVQTKLTFPVPNLPDQLEGLTIVQLSDLHLHPRVPDRFLRKIIRKVKKAQPDIIVFTGDFLCFSQLRDPERLVHFLNQFSAPYGCYTIFGNHDYHSWVTVNKEGDYDIMHGNSSMIGKGIRRLFSSPSLSGKATAKAIAVTPHQELVKLLQRTPFELLHNQSKLISIKDTALNICGLGEHMLGKNRPEDAFKDYHKNYPGIVLLHNPDGIPSLHQHPGDIILCGHTHGAQVNLPLLWKKFVLMENMKYKRGIHTLNNRWIYINRGVGSAFPFRLFAIPEILTLKLTKKS